VYETESVCVWEREYVGERERLYVCVNEKRVCVGMREKMCVCVCVHTYQNV